MRFLLLLLCAGASAQSGLDCLVDGLGGADRLDAVRELVLDATTDARLAGRDTGTRTRVAIRPDETVWTVGPGARRGQTTRAARDSVRLGGGAGALTGEPARRVRQAAWLHPAVLALRRAEVEAAEGSCDGVLQVTVPDFPEPLVIQLDESGRPLLLSTFRQRGAERVYLSVQYRDYRETDGVWVPRQMTLAEGGVQTGRTRITGVTVRDRP